MSPTRGASARRAGHEFEREVARYLGVPTTRSQRPGIRDDAGDLVVSDWLLELKNRPAPSRAQITEWLTTAIVKAHAADLTDAALVVKARNRPLGESTVWLTTATFARLVLGTTNLTDTSLVATDLYSFKAYLTLTGVLS